MVQANDHFSPAKTALFSSDCDYGLARGDLPSTPLCRSDSGNMLLSPWNRWDDLGAVIAGYPMAGTLLGKLSRSSVAVSISSSLTFRCRMAAD